MSLDTLLVQQHGYVKQLTAEVGQEFFAAFAMALGGRPFPPHALTMQPYPAPMPWWKSPRSLLSPT